MNKYTTKEFEQKLIKACQTHKSMSAACSYLKMHFNTFKKHAQRLNVYEPNQAGKGISKNIPKIPINDIIQKGLHPQYQSNKLRKRLIEEGVKIHKCENCGLSKWKKTIIPIELDHIDGDRTNHLISNLRLLCPNCHALTDTYRGKNTNHLN